MENVKKMILVPSELTDRLHHSPIVGTAGVITQLDQDMRNILKGSKLSDEENGGAIALRCSVIYIS